MAMTAVCMYVVMCVANDNDINDVLMVIAAD